MDYEVQDWNGAFRIPVLQVFILSLTHTTHITFVSYPFGDLRNYSLKTMSFSEA